MIPTARRLQDFGESVIGEMSRLAAKYGAINLSSGYPDFDPPAAILQAAHEALKGGAHQYGPSAGLQRLRQAIATKYNRFTGLEIDAQQHVTVTCGGTEAMLASMLALCNPGDRVAVVSPFYENYAVDAMLAGAQPVYISLQPPDFQLDRDELRGSLQQGVKALVFCNPSNPTGKVFSPDELQMIADLAREYNVVVIVDEVYEHIIFPPYRHTYIANLPGMFERTITCGSLSKTFSITGWRLGYVIAPAEITSGMQKIHEYITLGAATPLQEAAITALHLPDSYYEELSAGFLQRCNVLLEGLDQAGIPYIPPQGGYFVLADISKYGYASDTEFCRWLAQEIGVAAVPGSSFFSEPVNNLIRFNFSKSIETLQEAGRRLKLIENKLPKAS